MSHAVTSSESCSARWEAEHMSAAGTAPRAAFIVALEQPGPWGHDAIAESHLPVEVGSALEKGAQQAGGRLLLIRRPDRHADAREEGRPVTVLVAGGPPTDPWLIEGELDDPADLLRLPWQLMSADDPDEVTAYLPELEETRTPHLLVCTNGKRDVCCAVRGRPVAHGAAAEVPGRVWECSHTGGHRFSPTGILLPHRQVYARLTTDLAVEALAEAARGRMPAALNSPWHNRGRTVWDNAAQAAEVDVRARIGEPGLAALEVVAERDGDRWSATVTHTDGRDWRVRAREADGPMLAASCAKSAKPSRSWIVEPADR